MIKLKDIYEGKIKGADGKACWKGYRYAGTKDGKDKCIPVDEADVFGASDEPKSNNNPIDDIDGLFKDLEQDIKQADLEPKKVDEALGLTLAGVALSMPEIIKLIGKLVNILKRVPGLKSLSGDKLIAIGDKYHHKITGAFEWALKQAGVKDPAKVKKFAGILHHVIIAMLLIAGGVSMSGLVAQGSVKGSILKAALNAVKTKELRSFIISSASSLG
tara:strand:- start:57 stop:707 length:651 start_codon:yes stop_codon:yes gene_type:complete